MVRLFRVFVPVSVLALLCSEICLIFACFVAGAYLNLQVDPSVFLLYDGGFTRISIVTGSIVLGLYFHDLYSHIQVKSRILLAQQVCQAVGIALIAQAFISYTNPDLIVPRTLMMLGSGLTLVTVVAWRVVYSAFVFRLMGAQRLLLVGGSAALGEIATHLEAHPELGLKVVGLVDDCWPATVQRWGSKVLGPLSSVGEIARKVRPDRITIGLSERRSRMPVADLLDLRFDGFVIEEAITTYEALCGRIWTPDLRPAQLIFSGELGPRRTTLLVHTVLDFVLALIGCIIALPIMLLVALAVKLSSPGPILYRQSRVGLGDKPFTLFKFRSMRADAEQSTGAVWATRNDPRVTSIGRTLRKLRLDELPQLMNVLRGEMSIVGPRPERPEFVKVLSEQIPFYRQRQCVKPGITGWAQINHRYGDTMEDAIVKLEFDLYYIKNMSPSLDTYIIFHTLKTMLLRRGAQ
jgi:exopolysaccharide biosynthesis polyprenyl glycosylphosphotransferase